MPRRVQLRRMKGWKMPPNTVSVARPNGWGNPFTVAECGSAEEAVRRFREWLEDCLRAPDNGTRAALKKLKGKNLACWCHPLAPCHADVLIELANPIGRKN